MLTRSTARRMAGAKPRAKFFADPNAVVAEWVADGHATLCDQLGLKVRRRVSRELTPTLWFSVCYHLGRIRLLQLSQKGAEADDVGDWGHAAEAAYVDRFVTDDEDFHEIMGRRCLRCVGGYA